MPGPVCHVVVRVVNSERSHCRQKLPCGEIVPSLAVQLWRSNLIFVDRVRSSNIRPALPMVDPTPEILHNSSKNLAKFERLLQTSPAGIHSLLGLRSLQLYRQPQRMMCYSFAFVFLQRAQCSHCKRCISYSNSVCLSVCLSVRPSVTRRYCVKTAARSTVQFTLLDSKMCLVL